MFQLVFGEGGMFDHFNFLRLLKPKVTFITWYTIIAIKYEIFVYMTIVSGICGVFHLNGIPINT